MSAPIYRLEHFSVHSKRSDDLFQLLVATRFFSHDGFQNHAVSSRPIVHVLNQTFRIFPLVREENTADKTLTQTLSSCFSRILRILACMERFRDLDLIAITRSTVVEKRRRISVELDEELRIVFLIPTDNVARTLQFAGFDAEYLCMNFISMARQRVRKPVTRTTECDEDDIICPKSFIGFRH